MNLSLRFLPLVGLIFASCEDGNQVSTSGFDPLDPAGGFGTQARVVDSTYRPGEFVESAMPNTAFFKNKPEGEGEADTLLPAGTPLKVIATDGSFVKVERDSGEVGFVFEIMVIGADAATDQPGGDGEYQVWPPVSDGIIPLDGTEEGDDPDQPRLPTEVDPDAPESLEGAPEDVPPLPDSGADTPTGDLPPIPSDDKPVPDPAGALDSPADPDEPGADAVAPPIRPGSGLDEE